MKSIMDYFKNDKKEEKKGRVVLTINFEKIEKFKGFNYSIEEGKKLAKKSYTELPEFDDYKK